MKKNDGGANGASPPLSVDRLIARISNALGEKEWMTLLGVRPETVRTWRKRKAVPISKIKTAADLSGIPMEWFTSVVDLQLDAQKKFPQIEKQVIHSPACRADTLLIRYVVVSVLDALDAHQIKLSNVKISQLVELIYEHEVVSASEAGEIGVRHTTEKFLKLVGT